MVRAKRAYQSSEQVALHLRLQAIGDPDIASYIASLKRKFQKYAMSLDEARKVIDASMGTKTLTELLYETRE